MTDVLIGLLRADPQSYVSADPNWLPKIGFGARPTMDGGVKFGMQELLDFAASGSPPVRREAFAHALVGPL